jgi:hypothetical protein
MHRTGRLGVARIRALLITIVLLAIWVGLIYSLDQAFMKAGEDHHLSAAVTASATIALVLVTAFLTSRLVRVTELTGPVEQQIRDLAAALSTYAVHTFPGWRRQRWGSISAKQDADLEEYVRTLRASYFRELNSLYNIVFPAFTWLPGPLQPGILKLTQAVETARLTMLSDLDDAVHAETIRRIAETRAWSWTNVGDYCRNNYSWAKTGNETNNEDISANLDAVFGDIERQMIEYAGELSRWSQRK